MPGYIRFGSRLRTRAFRYFGLIRCNVVRKLNIVHTESSTGWGGQEIRILTEIKGFLARGHRLTLICPPNAELSQIAAKEGIEVTTLPIDRKTFNGLFAMRRWFGQHLAGVDVINTHSSTDSWLTALALATLPRGVPVVRTRHVSTAVNRSVATRWLYQRATQHIVTTGEALRRQLHRDNGYALDSMTSVPTGIDLNRFEPLNREGCRTALGLEATTNLIGIVATLRDWKGHSYLFEAMQILSARHPELQLLVIGDGPYEPTLRAKVMSLGLQQRVRFVGRQENIPEWLGALDLFVLPSYGDEGVPQAIIQAMACGLPVISTPIGSISEAVISNITGVLVAPRDSIALAEAMENLINQPELRSRFGEAGRAHSKEKFALEHMLDRMEFVFSKLVDAK